MTGKDNLSNFDKLKSHISLFVNFLLGMSGLFGLTLFIFPSNVDIVRMVYSYTLTVSGFWYFIDIFISIYKKKYHMVYHHALAIILFIACLSDYFIHNQLQASIVLSTHEISGFAYNIHYYDRTNQIKKYIAWFIYFWARGILFPLLIGLSVLGYPSPSNITAIYFLLSLVVFDVGCLYVKRKNAYNAMFSYDRYLKLTQDNHKD